MDYSNLVYFPERKIEKNCGAKYSAIFLSKEIARQMSYSKKGIFKEGEKITLCESEICPYNCLGEEFFFAESESGLVSICNFDKGNSSKNEGK